jgi:hypothetical protein
MRLSLARSSSSVSFALATLPFMTTLTWIYVVGGVVMSILALIGFFAMRKMRNELTRQSLPLCVGQFVTWMIPLVFFFRGVVGLFYFITVAVIYIPSIIYILKLPKDDRVA